MRRWLSVIGLFLLIPLTAYASHIYSTRAERTLEQMLNTAGRIVQLTIYDSSAAVSPSDTIRLRSGSGALQVSQNAAAYVAVIASGGNAPADAQYVTRRAEAGLSAEHSIGTLTTGLLLNTVAASQGTLSAYGGVSDTNYAILALDASGAATKDTLLTLGPTNATLTSGQLLLPSGTAAAPGISWSADSNSGFRSLENGTMDYVADGVSYLRLGSSIDFNSGGFLQWIDTANLDGAFTRDLFLGREAAAILQQGQDSVTPIAQTRKGPDGSGTDIVGGVMRVASGRSTGNAVPGILSLQGTAVSVTTGTGQQTLVDRLIPNAFKVLTNNSAIAVVNATIANGSSVGGKLTYTIEVWDGTDNQVEYGEVRYSAKNKAGVVSGNATEMNSQQELDSGTLTTTWAISAANPAVISINANSSLTPSTGYPRITFSLNNLGQQAVAIQ